MSCRHRNKNTITRHSSMPCAEKWISGDVYPTPIIGASRRKPPACSSTGATMNLPVSGPFSARSKPSKPPSGSLKWLLRWAKRSGASSRSGQRQQRSQPGADASGAQARHRGRQNHRDGHADRLADHQRRAQARTAKSSPGAFWSSPPASPSAIACAY